MAEESKKVTMTIGQTGLERAGGVIHEEFLPVLKGRKGIAVYKEMRDNDAVIGSLMTAITRLLRGVEWRVDPVDEHNSADVEAAEFIQEQIEGLETTWADTVSEILSFLVFGWSYFEILYSREGNRLVWRDFEIRSQETLQKWLFDDEGRVSAMVQSVAGQGIFTIPLDKALLFRTESSKGNPEGKSILRNAYVAYYRKKNIETIEGIGIERDLAGLPVIYCPPEWTKTGAENSTLFTELKDIVRNLRRDEQEGVVFPAMYDQAGNQILKLELLSTNGRRQFDTNQIVNRYDKRILMTALADFIMLGMDKVGSFALSSDKTDLFAVSIKSYLDTIKAQFNRKAIPKLLELNGMSGECILENSDLEVPDFDTFGQFIERMVLSGVLLPDEGLDNHVRGMAGLPALDEGTARRRAEEGDDDESL